MGNRAWSLWTFDCARWRMVKPGARRAAAKPLPRNPMTLVVFRQFLRFAAVGASGTAVQYAVLWLGVEHFGAVAAVASAIGYLLGAVVNYVLNYFLTFGSSQSHLRTATRYAALLCVGWTLNTVLMYVLVQHAHWYYWAAQIVATGIGLIWNFAGSRWWAFNEA